MRFKSILILLLGLLALSAGCTTLSSTEATITPTPFPVITTPTIMPVTTISAQKEINVTAWQTDRNVTVQYNGGRDAALLSSLIIQIDNKNGQKIKRTVLSPSIGTPIVFTYMGTVNADTVNVIGKFSDNTKQTVLLVYV